MRVLVVDDDADITHMLRQGLQEEGYVVTECGNGDDGLRLAKEGAYDLILLDIVMPRRDGLSMLTALRAANFQTPVIVLTARDQTAERIRGLEAGADDYLVKPFAFSELLARMQAVLRRAAPIKGEKELEIEDLRLDLRSCCASRGGVRIDLSMKEFLLLELLLRHRGQVLTRQFIAERIWGVVIDSDKNVIDVTIRRLRAKIDDGHARKIIHTARGLGYGAR